VTAGGHARPRQPHTHLPGSRGADRARTPALTAPRGGQALDRQLSSLEAGTATAAFSLESLLAEVEDLLSYCNDILGTGAPPRPAPRRSEQRHPGAHARRGGRAPP